MSNTNSMNQHGNFVLNDKDVIKALECCNQLVEDCEKCPYCNIEDCGNKLLKNALKIIKNNVKKV